MKRFDLGEHAGLLKRDSSDYIGFSFADVEKLAPDFDLLLNLSGKLRLKSILGKIRRRIYVDMDPGYSQIWQEQYGKDMNLRGHDLYITVGLNLGQPDCPLPTCGIRWENSLPPVVIGEWTTTQPAGSAYTTVVDWRGFSPVEWQGTWSRCVRCSSVGDWIRSSKTILPPREVRIGLFRRGATIRSGAQQKLL